MFIHYDGIGLHEVKIEKTAKKPKLQKFQFVKPKDFKGGYLTFNVSELLYVKKCSKISIDKILIN